MTRRVNVVPHTHWDREWYAPFQTFRLRLVDLLDEFLPVIEHDPTYRHFLLDGQMAVIDDYLAVRPEAAERLRRLAEDGRIAVGPWYILMDEFLVSGETIVRDLQLGLRRAAAFGGAMPVGYLPDMFGHVAQMPQLLRLAGLEHAVVWRGVPAHVRRNAFWWRAPDGSTVRAEYLVTGYGNGAALPEDADALIRRIRAHESETASFVADGPMLLMNGTDHLVPQPWLGRVVAAVNERQDDLELVITSLADHVTSAPSEGLPEVAGELRSGARANMLMGVASNRVDVKQAAARAERALEREAEPLAALYLDRWPAEVLDEAWREVIRNAAHDSVCACSHDDVGIAVLHRYAEATAIADGITSRALSALANSMQLAGAVVVNPSSRARGGIVELTIPGAGPVEGAQVVWERPARLADLRLTAGEVGTILGQLRGQQYGDSFINAVTVNEDDDGGLDIVLHGDAYLRTNLAVEEIKRDLFARAGARPDRPVRIRTEQPPARRLLCRVEDVPAFGWQRWQAVPMTAAPVTVDDTTISNGPVTVAIDESDGTFAIDGIAGFGRLVDEGDHGDTYNYSPPAHDTLVDRPDAVVITVEEAGPVRARVRIDRRFRWPEHVDGNGRRAGEVTVVVTSVLEIRAGSSLVTVELAFVNPARDHRLRAILPLGGAATSSHAECAFTIVERGLDAEGGTFEHGLPTFPSRRFVRAGALTVVHEGLLEYELVDRDADGARSLALTLLRATGMLSRTQPSYRPVPAGPEVALLGPQMLGPVQARFGIAFGACDPYALVDELSLPLRVVLAEGGGRQGARGAGLTVTGAEVSALQRVDGELELRVFNPTADTVTVTVGRRGRLVDLTGAELGTFDGAFELRGHGIATARLAAN